MLSCLVNCDNYLYSIIYNLTTCYEFVELVVEGTGLESLNKYLCTLECENQILRRFEFDTISVATDNFSVTNRFAGYEFGDYIYKGKLKNGQNIAISGPFTPSYDVANQQFMDEVSMLVLLEHENLMQLLGYCIKGTGVYLIYDFALYATLSSLLFDPDSALLGWDERYKILLGIARVLVYLHKHAPSLIIHRDVNPSCILLDEQMNPKLSNFKFTKPEDYFCKTTCGAIGYMAPEYVLRGHLSAKTDVYGFGVVVLETLSGHRVYENIPGINMRLLELVWSNWVEGTYSNIVDPRIITSFDSTVMKRVIHIGLLCIQALPDERPTMEEVAGMLLGTSSMDLLVPKRPWNSGNLDDGEEDIYLSDGNNLDDVSEAHYSTDEFEGR